MALKISRKPWTLGLLLSFERVKQDFRRFHSASVRACLVKVHAPLLSRLNIRRIMATSMKVSLLCTIRS